jgi:hypothetical protein
VVRGSAGAWSAWNDSTGNAASPFPGLASGPTGPFTDPGNGLWGVLAIGSNAHLYSVTRASTGVWSAWDDTTGSAASTFPSLAGAPTSPFTDPGNSQWGVLAIGTNAHLYSITRGSTGSWSAWDDTTGNAASPFPSLAGAPSAPFTDPTTAQWGVLAIGTNAHLYSITRAVTGTWLAWDDTAGAPASSFPSLAGGPTAPFTDPGNSQWGVLAIGSNAHLYSITRASTGVWSAWDDSTGSAASTFPPLGGAPTAPFTDPGNSQWGVLAIGASAHLYSITRASTGNWSAWDDTTSSAASSFPSLTGAPTKPFTDPGNSQWGALSTGW